MIKAFFEVYKILNKIGIKPKDVIGMGGDIVKMGKSLFNTRVNPKLLEYIAKNQKIPTKILENIKIHARTLKNTTESQKNLFLENIKSIQKAKTPKIPVKSSSPVTGVQKPATSGKELPAWTKGWKPTVIKGGKDGLATGGIANHFRKKFEDGTEIEGPQLPEDDKISLDEIVAGVVGKREDRPDWGIVGFKGGPRQMADRAAQGLSGGSVEEKANDLFKSMIYVAKNSDKETANTLYSAFDGMLDVNIKNKATGIEQDLAEKLVAGTFKIEEGIPTRIDDNTIFDIALQTFDKLPNDLQAKIFASTNLAKDESWSALLEGNNLGLEYNSDNQKIEGFYDVQIDSETLKPTIIRPMFTKDNLNDEIKKSIFIGHGDFPPNPDDFEDPEHYQMALQIWEADKNKEYFGIELVSEPTSNYTGGTATFDTKNVSGWATLDTMPGHNLVEAKGTIDLPNVLVEDKPIELSSSFYKDLDTEGKEAVIRADVPVSESITPYVEKKTGDWEDELKYGIGLDKTGKIGNWDTYLTGNIDQDKDYTLKGGLSTDFMGGTAGIDGYIDEDGNWQAFAGLKWKLGDGKKKDETYQTSDIGEAYEFSKDKIFATGGIANHFRKKFFAGSDTYDSLTPSKKYMLTGESEIQRIMPPMGGAVVGSAVGTGYLLNKGINYLKDNKEPPKKLWDRTGTNLKSNKPKKEPPKKFTPDVTKELIIEEVVRKFKENNPDLAKTHLSPIKEKAYKPGGPGYEFLKTITETFREQYGRDPSNSELAKYSGKHRDSIARTFKKYPETLGKLMNKDDYRRISSAPVDTHRTKGYEEVWKAKSKKEAIDNDTIRFWKDEVFWPSEERKQFFIKNFVDKANYGLNRKGAPGLTYEQLADEFNMSKEMVSKVIQLIKNDPEVYLQIDRPDWQPKDKWVIDARNRIKEARKYLKPEELKAVKNQHVFVGKLNQFIKDNPLNIKNYPNLLEDIEMTFTKDGELKRVPKSDKEIIEHVLGRDGTFSIQHGAGKATGQRNLEYVNNRHLTTRKINSGLLRAFEEWVKKNNDKILKKDNEVLSKIAEMEEYLIPRGLRIKIGDKYYGASASKMYDSETGEHTGFKKVIDFYGLEEFMDGPQPVPFKKMAFAEGGLAGVDQYILNRYA